MSALKVCNKALVRADAITPGNSWREKAMKMFFVILGIVCAVFAPTSFARAASAGQQAKTTQSDCGEPCKLYKQAQFRQPIPYNGSLVCVHFTLPTQNARVTLEVSRQGAIAIKDSKRVTVRDAQFCYPVGMWMRLGKPDKVFFCSEHSVTLRDEQIDPILSGPGSRPGAYACLRGIRGCGGVENVSISSGQLNR